MLDDTPGIPYFPKPNPPVRKSPDFRFGGAIEQSVFVAFPAIPAFAALPAFIRLCKSA
jgi:hypothetical protein